MANRLVQQAVREQLIVLAHKKAENRRLASKLTAHVSSAWNELDKANSEEIPDPIEGIIKSIIIEEDSQKEQENDVDEPLDGRQKKRKRKSHANSKVSVIKKTLGKWKYDPYRRWTRCFFVDPNGSVPEPNPGAVQRRTMEQGNFFFHTDPPWGYPERKAIETLVRQQQEASFTVGSIDWNKVAEGLKNKAALTTTKDAKPYRTPEECRLFYLGLLNQSPFRKEESLVTLEQIHYQGNRPSWNNVQLKGRTTWQTFCNHQMKLSSATKPTTWNPQQDELMLKFLAAMGPQYILTIAEAGRISMGMLHDKSPKVIMSRANQSLLNPTLARSTWSTEEDMTLALCMKIYHNDGNPLVPAGNHLPMRASQSVTAKWHRSLNPQFSTLPWTPEEDQRLIQTVKNSTVDKSWTQIAMADFPDRNPRTIQARWTEVASSEDLLKNYGEALRKREARGTLLSAKDFVLRVKSTADEDVIDYDDEEVDETE